MDARLRAAIAAWRLTPVTPFEGGDVALVCAAVRDGLEVVLKVQPRGHHEETQLAAECDALVFWEPTGAVPLVLDRRDGGLTFLMERLRPGQALDSAGVPWSARLTVLGRLARQLRSAGAPDASFIDVREYSAHWRRALAGESALLAELDELIATTDAEALIHADLHGGNALRHGDSWKVVDPHAVRADRNAETWALLDPLAPALPADPVDAARTAREWLAGYADAGSLDHERVRRWTRVRARAEALTVHDAAWSQRLHRMADALS